MTWDIFSDAFMLLYVFFGEVSVKVFCPFLIDCFLLLTFTNPLCILENSPVADMSFTNMFSQSVTCIFVLLILSFTDQKFLFLMKSSSSIISSMDPVFGFLS